MKSQRLMKALTFIDPKYIQEGEYAAFSNARQSKGTYRRLTALILAASLVFALALTAYAVNLFGIRELFGTQTQKLPEEAVPYIQTETAAAEATDWSCQITESLCDNASVMATVTISGGDKYIIAPTYSGPMDSVSTIGIPGNQQLGEYAAAQGKKLLLVGARITKVGNADTINGSQRMESISESEMVILTQCSKTVSAPTLDAVCQIYAQEAGSDEVQRMELPFTLTEAPANTEGETIYRTETPDAIPGMTVGDLHVTQTPLGINLRMLETVTDQEAYYNIMKFDIDGLTYGEGGAVLEDDGNYYFTVNMCQGTLGDTLVIHYFDWHKDPIGDITFRKVM